MRTLNGRVALITGAAGGIGSALAKRLATAGCDLAVVDLNAEPLTAMAAGIEGVRVTTHTANIGCREDITQLVIEVTEAHGGIDLLINNAGVTVFGAFAAQSLDDIDHVLQVNLRGLVYVCHACLPLLMASSEPHIVNMASMAGLIGVPMQSTYSASKFGVRGFSAALRAELAPHGIGVTTVLPGAVATPLLISNTSYEPTTTDHMASLMHRWGVTPDRLAHRVLKAVRRNRAELVVGVDSQTTRMLQTAAPWFGRWFLAFLMRRHVQRLSDST